MTSRASSYLPPTVVSLDTRPFSLDKRCDADEHLHLWGATNPCAVVSKNRGEPRVALHQAERAVQAGSNRDRPFDSRLGTRETQAHSPIGDGSRQRSPNTRDGHFRGQSSEFANRIAATPSMDNGPTYQSGFSAMSETRNGERTAMIARFREIQSASVKASRRFLRTFSQAAEAAWPWRARVAPSRSSLQQWPMREEPRTDRLVARCGVD